MYTISVIEGCKIKIETRYIALALAGNEIITGRLEVNSLLPHTIVQFFENKNINAQRIFCC